MRRRGMAAVLVLIGVCVAPVPSSAAPLVPATTWATFQTIPNATAGGRPTLVDYDNALWAFWPGAEHPSAVFYSRFDGTQWSAPQEMPSALTVNGGGGVGAAVDGKNLVVTWVDFGAPAYRIRYAEFDGTSWGPEQTVPNSHGGSQGMIKPGVHQFGSKLIFTWVGTYPFRGWYSVLTGQTWSPAARFTATPDQYFPGLALFGGDLYVAMKDATGSGPAEYAVYDGTSWSRPAIAAPRPADENGQPVAFGGHLDLFYSSLDNSGKISYATMVSAGSWTHTTMPSARTGGVPTAASADGRLWVAWQGVNNHTPTTAIRYTSTANP